MSKALQTKWFSNVSAGKEAGSRPGEEERAGPTRLELATLGVTGQRSNN